MDKQAETKTIQRDPVQKRTLIINAQTIGDFIRVGQLVKRFEEDVKKHGTKSGRSHGIIYTTAGYNNPVYVWYTTTQITFHFGEEPNG